MEKKKSLLKSGIILSIMTLASRIMGLLREMTKAAFLGTSVYADAFGIAFLIPNLLRRLFAENSISVAFIPTFRGYVEEENKLINDGKADEAKLKREETQKFISSTLTLVSFLTACVTVIGILIAGFIVPVFFRKEGTAAVLSETTLLTRIMFPYLFVISTAAFFQGILNGCHIFAPSGFTPVLFNGIVILVTLIFTPKLHSVFPELTKEAAAARAMSFGVITGGCVQALFQWPFIKKTGWKTTLTSLKNAFSNPGTRKVIKLIVPTILGMAAYQLNDLVSTALAGHVAEGTVSSLQYSLRLQELILGIFAVSIGTVILPDLSSQAKTEDWESFNKTLINAIKIITLITIPVTFYSLITGKELISVVYKLRSFNDESVRLTLSVFKWHIAGLFFIAVNRVITPAFYAQSNTKLPTISGVSSLVMNMLLAVILSIPMKGSGIALALSASSAINTICLFVFMKKMKAMNAAKIAKDMIIYILRMTAFSIIAAAPVYFLRPVLLDVFAGHNRFYSLGIPVVILAVIFAFIGVVLLLLFRDETAMALVKSVQRKIRK